MQKKQFTVNKQKHIKMKLWSLLHNVIFSGVTMGWLLRLLTGAPLIRGPFQSS